MSYNITVILADHFRCKIPNLLHLMYDGRAKYSVNCTYKIILTKHCRQRQDSVVDYYVRFLHVQWNETERKYLAGAHKGACVISR